MNTVTIIFAACLTIAFGEPSNSMTLVWLQKCLEHQGSANVLAKPSNDWTMRDLACHRTCQDIYKGIITVSGNLDESKLTKKDGFLEDIRSFLICNKGRTNCDLVECMMNFNDRHDKQ